MPSVPYMQSAEPYFHRGGRTGVLGLHGFTATPAEMRWLGEDLAARDLTVFIPRLTGHGTQPRDLARTRWRDWYASALDGYHILRAQCDRLFVVGHSMGGLLALLLSAEMPVNGAAVLGAPVLPHQRILAHTRWLKYLVRSSWQGDRSIFPETLREEQTRRGEPALGRVRYDDWSVAAVAELYALIRLTYARLDAVRAPLLLIYSKGDAMVPAAQADAIAQRVKSAVIEQVILETSDHVLPQDVEREDVFARVADFIERQG